MSRKDYANVINNKINRLISCVATKMEIDIGDRNEFELGRVLVGLIIIIELSENYIESAGGSHHHYRVQVGLNETVSSSSSSRVKIIWKEFS